MVKSLLSTLLPAPSTHPQQPLWLFLSPLSSLRHRVTNIHIFLLLLFTFPSLKENKLLSGWGIVSLITVSLGAVFFRFLGVHGPSWIICECSVLIRLGKFSSVNFSNIFSLLPTPLLQRLQLHIYFPATSEHLHCYLLHVTDEDMEASGGWQTCPEPHREGVDGSGLPQHLGCHWLAHTPSSCSP